MSAPTYLPVAKMYSAGTLSCYRVTEHLTAWIDYKNMDIIIGWRVSRDDDGLEKALEESGVYLACEEVANLGQLMTNGSFYKIVNEVKTPGTGKRKVRLRGEMDTVLTLENVPIYGVAVKISQKKTPTRLGFTKIPLRRLITLMEKLDFEYKEITDLT